MKIESDTIASQVDSWSMIDRLTKVTKFSPDNNKLSLSNGKEYTYKSLVLATGL